MYNNGLYRYKVCQVNIPQMVIEWPFPMVEHETKNTLNKTTIQILNPMKSHDILIPKGLTSGTRDNRKQFQVNIT